MTNAHVAAPASPGLDALYPDLDFENPDYLLIHLTDGRTDTNAPAAYRAKVVEADGSLDVAVIQVYANADGSDLDDDLDLPTVPVGDSGDLRAGDDVTVLGFPAVARSQDSITVTTGVVSTIINDPQARAALGAWTPTRGSRPATPAAWRSTTTRRLIGIPTALVSDRRLAGAERADPLDRRGEEG
nr:serine protease [Nocardioides convexus]